MESIAITTFLAIALQKVCKTSCKSIYWHVDPKWNIMTVRLLIVYRMQHSFNSLLHVDGMLRAQQFLMEHIDLLFTSVYSNS